MKKVLMIALATLFATGAYAGCSGISYEKFEQIQIGMTIDQVQQLLSCHGQQKSASATFQVWSWDNGSASAGYVLVSFRDGHLTDKQQANLN